MWGSFSRFNQSLIWPTGLEMLRSPSLFPVSQGAALFPLHPLDRLGCPALLRWLFPQMLNFSFMNSFVMSDLSMHHTSTFTNPSRRSGNKIFFSQQMLSLAYLNETAVVCCSTLCCEHPDQRINTRFKIRSSSASKTCSLCLWYANKESLNKFDSIKLIRGFKCRLS